MFSIVSLKNKIRYEEVNEWFDKPKVKVAVTVDAPAIVKLVMDRLTTNWAFVQVNGYCINFFMDSISSFSSL